MIYDAKISWDGGAVLYMDELTKGVLIPLKEACSGIGCMRMGATFLGLRCISSMGINPKVIGHLRLGNSDGKQLQRHIGCADVLHSPHHDLRATLPLHLRKQLLCCICGHCLGVWTQSACPDELSWHCLLLMLFPDRWILRAGALGDLSQEEKEIAWGLRVLLQQRGVPGHLTEEGALMCLSKIGAFKLKNALEAKDAWGQLKALGSAPRVNFPWIKPVELEEQIKKRTQSKFKINPSNKKSAKGRRAGSQPVIVDLLDPHLIEGTFVAEDEQPLTQLKISEVGANSCGIAFGQLSDVQPYLQLTTAPVPVAAQGLLPVINLRFPAIFKPTGEAILIEGSLIQLGDQTIHRVSNAKKIQTEELPAVVLNISVFRDEWPHSWESFIPSPVKAILGNFPAFVLCKGVSCGDGCNRIHLPVDAELGSVIAEVWNRLWLSLRGRKMPAAEADLFQVYFRTPQVCLSTLHCLSGSAGLYVEPRSVDDRTADQSRRSSGFLDPH
jgi:hypothetical protein